jgi:alkylation response protein AidB-like acyl-CoA dehydrogenase
VTAAQVVASLPANAIRIRDLAAQSASVADTHRRIDRGLAREIVAAGFAQHFVPEAEGGRAGRYRDLVHALAIVGEGCASTAWIGGVTATVARMAAYLPARGRAELWAEGPDRFIVGGLMPAGTAISDNGDWVLSGAWRYVSGAEFSDWALLCASIDTGTERQEIRYFAVEREHFTIRDTWFTTGMRGTASNTVLLDNVRVPQHRTFLRDSVIGGTDADSRAACHRVPLKAVNGLAFVAPALGAARGLLHHWPAAVGFTASAKPSLKVTFAQAAAELDMAEMLLLRAADTADRTELTHIEAARNSRDCALAAQVIRDAANRLYAAGGTRVQTQDLPVERMWRDVNGAVTHLALDFDIAADTYVSAAFSATDPKGNP